MATSITVKPKYKALFKVASFFGWNVRVLNTPGYASPVYEFQRKLK